MMKRATEDLIDKAFYIVKEAFKGKVDKGGALYINHLQRVSQFTFHLLDTSLKSCTEEEYVNIGVIAILHDLLEDCPEWTVEELSSKVSPEVAKGVDVLTRKKNQSWEDYIEEIINYPQVIPVKIADLTDNLNLSRLNQPLTEKDWVRIQKYHNTLLRLNQIFNS